MSNWLLGVWYGHTYGAGWLAPLAWFYRGLLGVRLFAYRMGLKKSERLPVPVLVVGNITVGGTGKTPLVLALTQVLRAAGWHPGILSRGYGGDVHGVEPVFAESDPGVVGDEPVLLARRAGVPVWVGRNRAQAGRALLAAHPEVDVLLCDDGLQHRALARDVELIVVDGARGLGNGHLLPWGPLREPASRLNKVDAVISTGTWSAKPFGLKVYESHLRGIYFRNVNAPEKSRVAGDFFGEALSAVAGIGNPERFFVDLEAMGLPVTRCPFPDHHRFSAADLPPGVVIMTEKDAVKCRAFAHPNVWVREVDAELDPALKGLILELLEDARYGH